MTNLRYLISTFSRRDRALLIFYVLAQFVVATTDVLGVAVVLPLMQILVGTDLNAGTLGWLHGLFGDPSTHDFVLILAGIMVATFVIKAVLASWLNWWSAGYVMRLQNVTSRRLLEMYMRESLLTHRQRNTGEMIRTVGSAVTDAHSRVLGGLLLVISSCLSIALIIAFLFVVTPLTTVAATVYFALAVFAIQRVLAPANRRAGVQAQHESWLTSHALVDAMFGFREAKLHDAEGFFIDRFDSANQRNSEAVRKANFLSMLPKNVLELATMVGITLLIVVVLLTGSAKEATPTLSLFVAATIKILPLMVGLAATFGTIRVGQEGLAITVDGLHALEASKAPRPTSSTAAADRPADATIKVTDVGFRYPDGHRDVLSGINVQIPQGTSLALCGSSGSGKTTLVDIILGLIPPTQGQVTYNGVPTSEGTKQWHDVVAYVPQDVYITDDSLAANIAFGLTPGEWDEDLIAECVQRAELSPLVEELPEGLQTLVGERGNRLSGGQRQRVGIARALYRKPRVIVLDEATSALDNRTEHQITQTLHSFRGDITTIVVAHRLSTVRDVDTLAFLSDGRVQAIGTFGQVVQQSPEFAHLVQLGRLDVADPLGARGTGPETSVAATDHPRQT